MRTLIVTVLVLSVAPTACKRNAPTDHQGVSGPADKPAMKSTPVARLERAAFIPADAVAYGSLDSQRLLRASKPIITTIFQMRARSSKPRPRPEVRLKGGQKVTIRSRQKPPKLTYARLWAMAKMKYGLDVSKLGRVTVIGVVPPPQPQSKPAFFGEPVFLASSAAYTPPPKSKPAETMGGVHLYAVAGRPTRSRIAVVGKTLIIGETRSVKRVLAVRLGKEPRMEAKAPLVQSIRTLRAAQPRATSYMVLHFPALPKTLSGKPSAWEKELKSGAVIFTDKSLTVVLRGQPSRIALTEKLLNGLVAKARNALPMMQKQLAKAAGPSINKLFDEVKSALKNVVITSTGDTLTLQLNASPVQIMTAAGMLAYLMA
jgi:hypothetical protein